MRRAPSDDAPPQDPYTLGVHMLARRELSVAQLRERLRAAGADADAAERALERLKREGAADDVRVAAAYARTAGAVKGRGRARVRREIELMGIDGGIARAAVDEALPRDDEDARITAALERRHPGPLGDERARRRLFAWLVRQGYEPERVRLALERKARGGPAGEP